MLNILTEPVKAVANEIYAAVQGEGPFIGTPCVFVRLHGCPVKCVWCDTAYTWDGSESGKVTDTAKIYEEVIALCVENTCNHVVVTGGEPLVQRGLVDLLNRLGSAGLTVEVETAAIRPPAPEYSIKGVYWNLSPKMPSAGARIGPSASTLQQWLTQCNRAMLKIVVSDEADYVAAVDLVALMPAAIPKRVYLMPCATTRADLGERLAWLIERAKGTGFRVTTRMHVTAFNDERGR